MGCVDVGNGPTAATGARRRRDQRVLLVLAHRRWRLIVLQFGLLGITAQQQIVRLFDQHVQRVVVADDKATIANVVIAVLLVLLLLMVLMAGGHRR